MINSCSTIAAFAHNHKQTINIFYQISEETPVTKMADAKVNTFFISEKISKVRWVPEQLRESERFLTGSWDMPKNFVRIWRLQRNQYDDSEYNEYVPRCCDKLALNGDVTGVEFVTDETAIASCSDGKLWIDTSCRTHFILYFF